MPNRVNLTIFSAFLLLPAGCASAQQIESVPAVPYLVQVADTADKPAKCEAARFSLDINFPSGAMRACEVVGKDRIKVHIAPEDAPPINASPWYAFRLTPKKPGRVTVEINYDHSVHRYWPKTSTNGRDWEALPQKSVLQVLKDGEKKAKKVLVKVDLAEVPVLLAAQEIIVPATYDAWLKELATSDDVQSFVLGKSREGRNIPGALIQAKGSKPTEKVVLVGRQHPPEVTGALGMFAFVDALASDTALAKQYRKRFATYAIPMLNPDGVVRGHWRHNTDGVDLNRDWGPFTQPETRLMRDLLQNIDRNPAYKLRIFLDFHSTQKDVVYTIPDEYETDPPGLISDWLERYQQRMGDYKVVVQPGHNADRPVSKAYIYEAFKAPSATFELGDETDRALIKKIGREAAIAMMESLLATDAP